MMHYLLPNICSSIQQHITCIQSSIPPEPNISQSVSHYLIDIKNNIQYFSYEWDIYKKYTNPYEYINTVLPNYNKSVSKYKPLSRSYFKMVEIITFFDIFLPNSFINFCNPINTFHLAEGPGGFIEAILNLRKNEKDKYVGMTLIDEHYDTNIPSWKNIERILKDNPTIDIEYGKDKTGNILSFDNFIYCIEKYGSSMDFITADGGFDFYNDYNNQEIVVTQLLFAQISYAICMQKYGGHFILKVFDVFMEHTIDLLCILSSFYKEVYITKPHTSRYANSEKYIVCKNFLFHNNYSFYHIFRKVFWEVVNCKFYINRFLNIQVPLYFKNKLEEYNSIFGQKQVENIHQTLQLIENNNKIDQIVKFNTQKCVNWCLKHGIQCNYF